MIQHRLMSVSPIDGRYGNITQPLRNYFSEFALFKYRIRIEIEYFIALADKSIGITPPFDETTKSKLRSIYEEFDLKDAEKIKEIEKRIKHDVKAVEYFVKEKLNELSLDQWKEYVHFGLTSQDINNTAIPKIMSDVNETIIYPALNSLKEKLLSMGSGWNKVPMLARTHGQAASPTTVGKELFVYVERLAVQLNSLSNIRLSAKFGGATGNFNSHLAAFPDIDWQAFAKDFLDSLSLQRQQYTTQIEHYDQLAALLDNYKRINTILIDLCQDIWLYISMDYFKQEIQPGEVGSSTMPHKVNPIDFENAEGNLGIANSFYEFLSRKLPISRLQRDLTDSTVTRNLGVPLAHSLIALHSIDKGLDKLKLNVEKIEMDLEKNWVVVSEAIQTILRRENYPEPYETLKELTRSNENINKEQIHAFIDKLELDEKIKKELKQITPHNYIGVAKY